MTTTEFGVLLDVSHVAVLKWESGKTQLPPTTEICIRLYAYDQLKAKNDEFRKFYSEISIAPLIKRRQTISKVKPFKIDAKGMQLVA